MTSVIQNFQYLDKVNPVRQMLLFGLTSEQRAKVKADRKMHLLGIAIDKAAEDASNYLDKKYNLIGL